VTSDPGMVALYTFLEPGLSEIFLKFLSPTFRYQRYGSNTPPLALMTALMVTSWPAVTSAGGVCSNLGGAAKAGAEQRRAASKAKRFTERPPDCRVPPMAAGVKALWCHVGAVDREFAQRLEFLARCVRVLEFAHADEELSPLQR